MGECLEYHRAHLGLEGLDLLVEEGPQRRPMRG
jgi:hypothetical protein